MLALLVASGCASMDTSKQGSGEDAARTAKIAQIDALLEDLVTDGKAAGIALGIQVEDEDPIIKAYGLADVSTRRKIHGNDQFRIASVTKPLTATAVLKLVEMRKLSLDDQISKFFPAYPNSENITIYQLLSHTSGIPNWWEGELPSDTPKDFPMCAEPHRYLARMKTASTFPPGGFYKYSNTGYVLLGEIIAKLSRQSYDDFLAEHVFAPAGMNNTAMEYIDEPSDTWVKGYARGSDPAVSFVDPEIYHMPFAAGGLRSSVPDLLKFMNALLGGEIVSRERVAQMTSYARVNDGRPTYEARFVAPGNAPSKSQESIDKRGYGFGFNLMELYGRPAYYHSGGIAGFNSYLLHVPENRTTIVLLANTEDGLVPGLNQVLKIAAEM